MDPQDNKLIYWEKEKKPSVWVVYTLSTASNITIQSICTTPKIAALYRKGIQKRIDSESMFDTRFENLVKVWVDRVWVNHLIGFPDLEEAFGEGEFEQFKEFSKK